MNDVGVASAILGIKIVRIPYCVALSQSHYIEKVLEKFKYLNFNIIKTPINVSFHYLSLHPNVVYTQ